MEALTISAANLNTIENNLGEVAKELNGVISNVNYMNNQVYAMESKVENLNNEIQNMMQEIRENTILTNARQSIMYNNQVIEKKFGYHDNVRRTTISTIDAIKHSSTNINSIKKLKENILLNNPNYWLSNAFASLSSWILNDKENTYKELNNALRINEEKTSLFFTLINLKFSRIQTATKWLEKYLSLQNPTNLDKDFVSVLDLISSGIFGDEQKIITLNKITNWQNDINSNENITKKQIDSWFKYIIELQNVNDKFKYLPSSTSDYEQIEDNLILTSTYKELLDKFESITKTPTSNKQIDAILNNLIYDYDEQEQIYQEDNFKNNLIIECNGDKKKALELYNKQRDIFSSKQDINSLLTNIAMYPDKYKISNETQKIAIALIKKYITLALEDINSLTKENIINIEIDNFKTTTKDGNNYNEILKEIDVYLEQTYITDKASILPLIITNVIGILSIILTLQVPFINIILLISLIIINIILAIDINKKITTQNNEKKRIKNIISNQIEKVFAEITDYSNIIKENKIHYKKLLIFINNLKPEDYIKNNKERNIML